VKYEGRDREYLLATYFDYAHHGEKATLAMFRILGEMSSIPLGDNLVHYA
jgi:hypothetical protein